MQVNIQEIIQVENLFAAPFQPFQIRQILPTLSRAQEVVSHSSHRRRILKMDFIQSHSKCDQLRIHHFHVRSYGLGKD